MEKLPRLFKVEFKGKEDRKPRTDKSNISQYRSFILHCSQRGIPRSVMLKVLQKHDESLQDYNLLAFNLYCSRMFSLTPINGEKDSSQNNGGGGL